jgi:DNA-directed RNA polymerase specialized sigma24 family protein
MPGWSAERLTRALDARARDELNALARDLIPAVVAGRAILLAKRPYLRAHGPNKDDDVQEVLVALFRDDGRILRKFDPTVARRREGDDDAALRRFVIGITWNVLQRSYQKRRVRWEELKEDLVTADPDSALLRGFARFARVIDLERAVDALSASDRALFSMIYVEQREQAECCASLGIAANTFQARKSRLLKRLRGHLEERGPATATGGAHG